MDALTKRQQILAVAAVFLSVVLVATGIWIAVRRDGSGTAASPGPAPNPSTGVDATARPAPGGQPAMMTVTVYFHRGQSDDPRVVVPVRRTVPRTPAVATATLRQLLTGPTAAEREAGYHSDFSEDTADALLSLRIGNGLAHADFSDFRYDMPTAGTSAGTAALFAELDTTLEQFDTVRRTIYSFNGDVAAFYEWLQLTPPVGMPPDLMAARTVAERWLATVAGMSRPVYAGARWRSDFIAVVDFHHRLDAQGQGAGPLTTVVLGRSGVSFSVVQVGTETIAVDQPAGAISPEDVPVVTSPLRVAGTAANWEGTVNLRVVQTGVRGAASLGEGFVTASGSGADGMAPFSGQIAFRRPTAANGWLLAYELSARDGAMSKLTAVRVRFAGVPAAPTIIGVAARAVPALPELVTEPGAGLARNGWIMPTAAGRVAFTVRTTAADRVSFYLAELAGDTVGTPKLVGTATRSGSTFTYTWRYADAPRLDQLSVVASNAYGRAEQDLVRVYHR